MECTIVVTIFNKARAIYFLALNNLVQYCKQKEKHYGCNDMKFNYIYYEVRITKIKIWKRIMFSVISCFCIVVRCIIIQSWLSWRHHFEHFTVATKNWLTVMECQCHKWPRIYSTCRKHFPVLSSFMTYHRATRLTRRVPLVEQELLTLLENLSSPPILVGFVIFDF